MSTAQVNSAEIIVIGAGVAGLAAARLLARAGSSVVVLEARDRLGGRVHTDRSGGMTTDLGASWIHGITDAPLFETTEAFGMRTMEFTVGSYQPDSRPIAYYGPDGTRLDPAEAAAFADDVHTVDLLLAQTISDAAHDASYGRAVVDTLARLDWDEARIRRVHEFLEHRTEEQYGAWIDDLAAHGLDDDDTLGEEVVFPDGYDVLPTRLAEGLDIRYGHEVTGVDWSPDGVTVRVATGESFSAPHAVITVSVGVLKSSELRFSPALPQPISGALDRLEMNDFEKIFLRFPDRFWDEDVYAIRRHGDAARWWHSWYDLTALHGEPTLLTFAAGPCAREIRAWTDEQVTDSVLGALREIYGNAVGTPTAVTVTHWHDDPYARGSYAYMVPGSTTADHDILATPVGNGALHLAGEATWTDDPATVTAALCSGHRAAQNVLRRTIPLSDLWS